MEPLTVVCWKWQHPTYKHQFTAEHVNVLQRMVARHYPRPHRFACITDDPAGIACETLPLWDDHGGLPNPTASFLPSCFRRLKLFSGEMLPVLGPRVLSLDLDIVITGDLTELLEVDCDFIGWALAGTHQRRVFNGSMWMVKPGALDFVWSDFDPERSPKTANAAGFLGSDQGWMSYLLAAEYPGWTRADGVYSYAADIYPRPGRRLPENARVVVHHGKRKPWLRRTQQEARWVKEHWR